MIGAVCVIDISFVFQPNLIKKLLLNKFRIYYFGYVH
jgi:hypothetical protein